MNDTVYLIIGILTVLAVLAGISAMSRVRSARAGNAIGAIAVGSCWSSLYASMNCWVSRWYSSP